MFVRIPRHCLRPIQGRRTYPRRNRRADGARCRYDELHALPASTTGTQLLAPENRLPATSQKTGKSDSGAVIGTQAIARSMTPRGIWGSVERRLMLIRRPSTTLRRRPQARSAKITAGQCAGRADHELAAADGRQGLGRGHRHRLAHRRLTALILEPHYPSPRCIIAVFPGPGPPN